VPSLGIEPSSHALQACAEITRLAHSANMYSLLPSRNYKYSVKNFYFFNFKEQFLLNNLDIVKNFPNDWETNRVSSTNMLSTEGLNFIKKINMKPFPDCNLFISRPMAVTEIHCDGLSLSYALNYSWNVEYFRMKWFKEIYLGKEKYTTAKTRYTVYDYDQVELIEEVDIPGNSLILIRINVPHSVENFSNNERYCLSIRGIPVLNWEDIVSYFKNYLLLE
jgi:hypothetical protein